LSEYIRPVLGTCRDVYLPIIKIYLTCREYKAIFLSDLLEIICLKASEPGKKYPAD